MKQWLHRLAPWAVALVVGLAALGLGSLNPQASDVRPTGLMQVAHLPGASTACPPPETCTQLVAVSEYTAGLIGSLAMVDAEERPEIALGVSEGLRRIEEHYAQGTDLGEVLSDLADALESYAGGDPAAVADIRSISARNAQVRARYQLCTEENQDE